MGVPPRPRHWLNAILAEGFIDFYTGDTQKHYMTVAGVTYIIVETGCVVRKDHQTQWLNTSLTFFIDLLNF